MNLNINKVEKGEFYLKVAVDRSRKIKKSKAKDRLNVLKDNELQKLKIINERVNSDLYMILDNFPDFNKLNVFYKELIDNDIKIILLKKNLSNIKNTLSRINNLYKDYRDRVMKTKSYEKIRKFKKEYLGRVCSLLRKSNKSFEFLEKSRKKIKDFPSIKTKIDTVCIFGFPNVGKSTLLKKLSGAGVEIQNYAFTTKKLMLGYIDNKIQLIDTPGSLNRFDKMNKIEKRAHLAVKYLCSKIIYVFDITEECGFNLKDQVKLMDKLIEDYSKKEILIYFSKQDIFNKENKNYNFIKKKYDKIKKFDDFIKIKKYLIK